MTEEKDKKLDKVKIALLGSTGVGKTCIIKRYAEDTYEEDGISTPGGCYYEKIITINEKKLKIELWDTAGQEKYRALGKHFYKDAYIVCLVYDITKESSFEDLKNIWYNDLINNGAEYNILAVVGNKSDDFENEQIKEEKAREYAEKINASYFLTSAKTGDGIDKLFENACGIYLDPNFLNKINNLMDDRNRTVSFRLKKQGKKSKGGSCCLNK